MLRLGVRCVTALKTAWWGPGWMPGTAVTLPRTFTKGHPSLSSRSPSLLTKLARISEMQNTGGMGFARASQAQGPSRQASTCCHFLDSPGPIATC